MTMHDTDAEQPPIAGRDWALAAGWLRFVDGMSGRAVQRRLAIDEQYYVTCMRWLFGRTRTTLPAELHAHGFHGTMRAYAAGLADAGPVAAMYEHLQQCPGCLAYLTELLDGTARYVASEGTDALATVRRDADGAPSSRGGIADERRRAPKMSLLADDLLRRYAAPDVAHADEEQPVDTSTGIDAGVRSRDLVRIHARARNPLLLGAGVVASALVGFVAIDGVIGATDTDAGTHDRGSDVSKTADVDPAADLLAATKDADDDGPARPSRADADDDGAARSSRADADEDGPARSRRADAGDDGPAPSGTASASASAPAEGAGSDGPASPGARASVPARSSHPDGPAAGSGVSNRTGSARSAAAERAPSAQLIATAAHVPHTSDLHRMEASPAASDDHGSPTDAVDAEIAAAQRDITESLTESGSNDPSGPGPEQPGRSGQPAGPADAQAVAGSTRSEANAEIDTADGSGAQVSMGGRVAGGRVAAEHDAQGGVDSSSHVASIDATNPATGASAHISASARSDHDRTTGASSARHDTTIEMNDGAGRSASLSLGGTSEHEAPAGASGAADMTQQPAPEPVPAPVSPPAPEEPPAPEPVSPPPAQGGVDSASQEASIDATDSATGASARISASARSDRDVTTGASSARHDATIEMSDGSGRSASLSVGGTSEHEAPAGASGAADVAQQPVPEPAPAPVSPPAPEEPPAPPSAADAPPAPTALASAGAVDVVQASSASTNGGF